MAEEQAKKAASEPKGSALKGVLSVFLTVVLAGGAAFGGARLGAAAHVAPAPTVTVVVPAATPPPGPTIALEPFLVTLSDPQRNTHVLKLTIAIELKVGRKDDELKPFIPRVRDSTLSYLRSLSYEEAQSQARFEHLRADLLDRIQKLGVTMASQVLITDYVTQ